jgi:RecA/RadA recombinase
MTRPEIPDEYFPEREVLGCILSGADIPAAIDVRVFASPRNRIIFKAFRTLKEHMVAPDLVILTNHLKDTGELEAVGGPAEIADLTTGILPSQIQYFADTLIKRCEEREQGKAIRLAAERIQKEPANHEQIVKELRQRLESRNTGTASRFEPIDTENITPPEYVVKGFIERESFISIFGAPEAGKSFLAIELAACVATGTPFYGMEIKHPGPVLYIAAEGQSGIRRRFRAWGIARQRRLENVYSYSGVISLNDAAAMQAMTAALSDLINSTKTVPSLVVLDTWSRSLGGDDSDTRDSAAGLASLDAFRKRFDQVATIIVHHEGHQAGRARGWSGIHAAVDTEYRAIRGMDSLLRLECTKAKEARRMDPMAFEFADVDLGITHEDGNLVTSAVLNQVEYYPDTDKDKKKALGKNQALALDLLKKLCTEKRWVSVFPVTNGGIFATNGE